MLNPIRLFSGLWPVFLLALLLLVGCSQPAPVALRFNPAPWQEGETHTFRLTDSDGTYAGTMTYTLTSGTNDAGERLWSLLRQTQAQDGQETITVKFFEAGFRPQASLLERSSTAGTETVDAQYAGPAVDLVLTTRADVATTQRIEIPSDVREAVTIPMLVRALPLARGYATQLNSFLPVAGTLERVTVRVVGDESLPVAAGLYDTWVVLLDTGDTVSRLWVAQNAPYPVVKYIDGRNRATLELEQYTP